MVQLLSMRFPQIGELFNQFATNPLVTYGASEQAAGEEQEAWDEYKQDTDADIERALSLAGERPEKAAEIFGDSYDDASMAYMRGTGLASNVLQNLPGQIGEFGEDFLSRFSGMTGDILEGYGDRYRFAEEELEGYGASGRADINRLFDEDSAAITQDLIDRGLLSSTEAATQQLGSTERRSAELRRLEDDLIRNRLDTLTGLSGETLGAQTSLGLAESGFEAAIQGDEFAANQLLAQFYQSAGAGLAGLHSTRGAALTDIYTGTTADQLNVMQGITRVPPPQSDLSYRMGYGSPQTAQAPSSNAGWVSGGLQAAGGLASLLAMGGGGGSMPSWGSWGGS
jgi:hypothetical protein